MPKHAPSSILTIDSFYKQATKLRTHFDEVFADPRRSNGERFVWDYWHVPEQYTLLRTPAYHFFPKKVYEDFHRSLVAWGRANLGCHDISPPWMSVYVDGCEQKLHGDLPHGPWAFVYSLTPWSKRLFRGGETLIMKESILSYWEGMAGRKGLEQDEIFTEVEPRFNRLTVFDPRIPHGVKRVEGVQDVREGRLVIHGWFVQPKPIIDGPLSTKSVQQGIDELGVALNALFNQGLVATGVITLKLRISPAGRLRDLSVLTNTVRILGDANGSGQQALLAAIADALQNHLFARTGATSTVTLPLIFENS